MKVRSVGIITGGAFSQASVIVAHAHDIGSVLEKKYQISYFDLSKSEDIDRLIAERKKGNLDIVFNNAAGKKGGDGTIEGFLDILGIPYVGSDVLATAVAFDKKTTKAVVDQAGVPTIKGISVSQSEFKADPSLIVQNVSTSIGYPVVVKASQGSDSIGISLVKHPRRLIAALNRAFKEDEIVIIEEFISRKQEVTCTVIGNGSSVEAFLPVERMYSSEIFTADASDVTYQLSTLDKAVLDDIMRYAQIAHQSIGCADYSRSDFLVDNSNGVFFLEINGHAGLGKGRSTALTAEATKGFSYDDLIEHVLNISIKRHR